MFTKCAIFVHNLSDFFIFHLLFNVFLTIFWNLLLRFPRTHKSRGLRPRAQASVHQGETVSAGSS